MAVVGFIGLGVMGRSMAVNLVKAGHEVWRTTCAARRSRISPRKAQSLRRASPRPRRGPISS